jgi:lysozyme
MPKFSEDKFLDFFKYYTPEKAAAVRMLSKHIPADVLADEADWVQEWRKVKPVQSPSKRQINKAGKDMIKEFEGLRLKAYQDSVGVWTIGYGHTATAKPGMEITEAQADALLTKDLAWAESAVLKLVTVPLTDNQFAALVSFVFNLGAGALEESTLLRLLNARFAGVAAEFSKWVFAGGRILPGLVRRREAEAKLFSSGSDLTGPSESSDGPVNVKVRTQAQTMPKSCGQCCVAMAISTLTPNQVDDNYVNRNYGFALLAALNAECKVAWKDLGDLTKSKWALIRKNLLAGYPVIIGLNGPTFSPSGIGHIVLITGMAGNKVMFSDPNGGRDRTVDQAEMENCPPHPDGKFIFAPIDK